MHLGGQVHEGPVISLREMFLRVQAQWGACTYNRTTLSRPPLIRPVENKGIPPGTPFTRAVRTSPTTQVNPRTLSLAEREPRRGRASLYFKELR
jgi:hypothetical protein